MTSFPNLACTPRLSQGGEERAPYATWTP